MIRRLTILVTVWLVASSPGAIGQAFVPGVENHPQLPERLTGNVLLGELGCVSCHVSGNAALVKKSGPDLSSAGTRVAGAYLRKFIAEPSVMKPGTTMPDVLGHLSVAEKEAAAEALTHYLVNMSGQRPAFTPPKAEAVERGRKLYHSVGCVACHSPESSIRDSVPLGVLEDKYSVTSLTKFLEDPLNVRPGGRMPDLKLDHFEAEHIASYLLRKQTGLAAGFQVDPKLAAKGAQLFVEYRCHACHSVGQSGNKELHLAGLDKIQPDRGCLSTGPGAWPKYALSNVQRDAIRAALKTQVQPISEPEQVTMMLARFNCFACHQRDSYGGVSGARNEYFTGRDENLGDQGRLPPRLTGVGAKLKGNWLREVVVNGASVRPYLNTRMPRFGAANTEELAPLLKKTDQPLAAKTSGGIDIQRLEELGRELAGTKGLNCVACHTFRGRSAAAIRALDLMSLAERLEENWFRHYLADPQQFAPLTIMPSFWPDGKSPLPNLLDGDAGKQQDALWKFFSLGPNAREPLGLVLEPLIVTVKDEAVILRRAYPGIGKRGIGVGYPAQINLAFDAEKMRLGSIWTGGFIEASSLWRGQGAGQARILGKDTFHFPAGPAFARLDSPLAAWPEENLNTLASVAFKGYWLDAKRRPAFQYQIGDMQVEDFFKDALSDGKKPYLTRSITVKASPEPKDIYFRLAVDKRIVMKSQQEYLVGDRLQLRISQGALLREAGGAGKELVTPVSGTMVIEYHLLEVP